MNRSSWSRIIALGLTLSGCLDVREAGGTWDPQYESDLPNLLRPDGRVLFGAGGFGFETELTGWREANGDLRARVDPFRHETDLEWHGLLGAHAIELYDLDGSLETAEDQFHFDLLDFHDNGAFTSRLFCNTTVELWVSTETTDGWVSGTLDLGDTSQCGFPSLLGPGAADAEVVVLLDQVLQQVSYSVVDGELLFDQTALPQLAVPAEPLWVGVSAGQPELVGRNEAGEWLHITESQSEAALQIAGAPLGFSPVTRVDEQSFDIQAAEGRWTWQPGASEVAQDAFPSPTIDATWQRGSWPGGALAVELGPHPLSEPIVGQVAVQALVDDGAGVVLVDVPLTPCVDRSECDALGEFTVVGLYRGPKQVHVVYDYLSWWLGAGGDEFDSVYLAPLDSALE